MDSPFIWHELATPDAEAAKKFYNTIFGWNTDPMPMNDMGFTYELVKTGENNYFAGMMPTNIPSMEGTPPHWAMYVQVDDVDATVAAIKANGGMCMVEPMDIPQAGRMALCADPQGASFWVMKPNPMPEG